MLGPARFRFLNCEREVRDAADWDRRDWEALWVYNLHYFDDLNAVESSSRTDWHRAWIARWLKENPPGKGRGWDSYPTSLRLVNWIKWLWSGHEAVSDMVDSMAIQTRWLAARLEHHLLGNHLLANAKALVFAGLAFDGQEADEWLRTGLRLLREQLAEQILPDGGHFELSPMYHALVIEDLLDLVHAGAGRLEQPTLIELGQYAARALGWLQALADEQGRPPLLNDSAHGVAPGLGALCDYAARVEVQPDASRLQTAQFAHGWSGCCCSGYWVLEKGPFRLWFDAAPIGPDYLPGHAHGDMLSVLMNFSGEPVLTDTGVSTYEAGLQRNYERSVAAHNTARIDHLDQAEFWASFRVGRRGYPRNLTLSESGIECGHDGFLRQRRGLYHKRALALRADGFIVTDELLAPGTHSFELRWHFAPGTAIDRLGPGQFGLANELRMEVEGGEIEVGESRYSPEYGLRLSRPCLRVSGSFCGEGRVVLKCIYCS